MFISDNHDILSMKLYDIGVDDKDHDSSVDYSKIEPSADFFAPHRGKSGVVRSVVGLVVSALDRQVRGQGSIRVMAEIGSKISASLVPP